MFEVAYLVLGEDQAVSNDSFISILLTMASVSESTRIDEPLANRLIRSRAHIDPQVASPLFTKFPREVRDQIWQLAFEVYEDFNNPYPLDKVHVRPGQAARQRIDLALLLSCRAVYLETYLMPFRENTVEIYAGDEQDVPTEEEPFRWAHFAPPYYEPISRMQSWQFANLTKVSIRFQQNQLEDSSHLRRVGKMMGASERHDSRLVGVNPNAHWRQLPVVWGEKFGEVEWPEGAPAVEVGLMKSHCVGQKITELTIRLGMSDWWSWTDSPADSQSLRVDQCLRLEPMHTGTADVDDAGAMLQGYLARKNGEELELGLSESQKARCWGNALHEAFPDLERLELELEAHEQKAPQLDTVIECGKLWTFPQDSGYEMRWDGDAELPYIWKGPMNQYIRCPWMDRRGKSAGGKDKPEHTAWARTQSSEAFDNGIRYVVQRLVYRRKKIQQEPDS
ncbi:hypothetical protein PG991_007317 [Apiospora marii]|uniref:Uncharacterized protein n=1 Tax=Apiospora marii TaxID=335849 RepID=A0ABR1RTH8_9PEZI